VVTDVADGVLSGRRFVSRPEIVARAERLAGGLAGAGVGPGDAVALLVRNDTVHLETSLAAARVGAFPVPINWHWRGDEVEYLLRDSGARALVAHADLLAGVRESLPPGILALSAPTPPEVCEAYGISDERARPAAGDLDYGRWVDDNAPLAAAPTDATSLSMIYTSGTTGRPKGVQRIVERPEEIAGMQQMLVTAFGLRPDVRSVIPAPMYHSAPNAYALVAFGLGGLLVLMPKFDPVEFLELVQRHAITHVQTVPTMFVRLLQLPEEVRRSYDVSSLEYVVHAAAPCPAEVKQAMIDWWGPIIWEYYGCTESGAVVLCSSEEWLAHPGTVGRPFLGAEVQILDPEGNVVPPGVSGDVFVRMHGTPDFTYKGDDDKRRRAGHGPLVTCGDVGFVDHDGFLYLNDRRNDMVISGGVNVYPAEIEATLLKLPGVRDSAVFGIPDAEYGEALAAHLEVDADAGLTSDAVRAFVGQHLAGYKVPKVVVFEEELPREDSGKIFKRRLRDPYWAGHDRRI
jgi:long-chain acyl-CoA synthetase